MPTTTTPDLSTRPAFLLYVNGHVTAVEDPPETEYAATRCLAALLYGADAGSHGRVEALTYPERRGLHAYRTVTRYSVDAHGVPRREALPEPTEVEHDVCPGTVSP